MGSKNLILLGIGVSILIVIGGYILFSGDGGVEPSSVVENETPALNETVNATAKPEFDPILYDMYKNYEEQGVDKIQVIGGIRKTDVSIYSMHAFIQTDDNLTGEQENGLKSLGVEITEKLPFTTPTYLVLINVSNLPELTNLSYVEEVKHAYNHHDLSNQFPHIAGGLVSDYLYYVIKGEDKIIFEEDDNYTVHMNAVPCSVRVKEELTLEQRMELESLGVEIRRSLSYETHVTYFVTTHIVAVYWLSKLSYIQHVEGTYTPATLHS